MPRITSKETYIEFKPGLTAAETPHIQHLYFDASVNGGTFKLRVNGELTAAITMSGTALTDVGSINSALDALTGLAAGDIVATGSAITDITLTGAANGYYRILIDEDSIALTGNTGEALRTEVTQVGGVWTELSADLSEFQYEVSKETTDVTGMSEEATTVLVTKSSASVSGTFFEALQSWAYMMHDGIEGRIRVFTQGKVVGKRYLEAKVLIESVSYSIPDHDVNEVEISGMRQGDWIAPPNSIWA